MSSGRVGGSQVVSRSKRLRRSLTRIRRFGASDSEVAVLRMLKNPKRDVFEFPDGRQLTVDELPPGMIFDSRHGAGIGASLSFPGP